MKLMGFDLVIDPTLAPGTMQFRVSSYSAEAVQVKHNPSAKYVWQLQKENMALRNLLRRIGEWELLKGSEIASQIKSATEGWDNHDHACICDDIENRNCPVHGNEVQS